MIVKFLLGFIVLWAAVIAAIAASGGSVPGEVAIQTVLSVFGMALGALLAGPGPQAVADLFRSNPSLSRRRATKATLDLAGRALTCAAILGFLVPFTVMLKSLENPADLWPNLAWALGPVLVALVFQAAIILPLRHRGEASSPEVASKGTEHPQEIPWNGRRLLGGGILTLVSLFFFAPLPLFWTFFFDPAAIVIALFVPVGVILSGAPAGAYRRAFSALSSAGSSLADLTEARGVFGLLASALRRAAAIGAVAGLLFLVKDWLNQQRYGPTIALAVISVVWATAILVVLVLPLEAEADRRLSVLSGASSTPGSTDNGKS